MNEKLAQALGYVDEAYIAQAAKYRSVRHKYLAPIAAILALVLILSIPSTPATVSATEVSIPTANRLPIGEVTDYSKQSKKAVIDAYDILADFTSTCSAKVLAGADDTNRIWAPASAYISLAIAAELSEGSARQELLDVLNAPDTDVLRQRISGIWENVTVSDDSGKVYLSNSLWLDESVSYDQARMDDVAYHYYAPVLQRDLSGTSARKAVANWVRNQTNGKLSYDGNLGTGGNNALALISTLYLQSDWTEEFDKKDNRPRIFHANSGDYSTTFMFQKLHGGIYYWSDDFSAIQLMLKCGAFMWFILPDEDKTIDQVLSSGDYMDMITASLRSPWENQAQVNKIHLYLPKFTIANRADLKSTLQDLGVQKVFDTNGGAFSQSLKSSLPIFLDGITQQNRVEINEYGVIATGYTELHWGYGASAPNDDFVEMIFDRPFLIVIQCHNVPLIVGTVNHP